MVGDRQLAAVGTGRDDEGKILVYFGLLACFDFHMISFGYWYRG